MIDATLDPFILSCALLLATPIAVFLHELGHALADYLTGFVVTSFGLGTARPWLVVDVRGVKVYSGLVRPLQGITFAFHPDLYPSRFAWVASFSGGMLANAASAVVGLALWIWSPWARDVWFAFFVMSAIFAVASLVPYRFWVGQVQLRSDGALIVDVLRSGAISLPAPLIVQTLDGFRGLWLDIGDTLCLRLYTLASAMAWVDLQDIDEADRLLTEAESVQGIPSSHVTALAALARAHLAIARNRPDGAERALDEAEAAYRSSGRPAGLVLVGLFRVSADLMKGDAAHAMERLDGLEAEPIVKGRSPLGATVLALRLDAACRSGSDEGEVAALLDRYERLRQRWRSAAVDLRVYEAIVGFRSRAGDATGALAAWRGVLEAIRTLASAWADPERRSRFLSAQSERIGKIRVAFEVQGRAEEVDQVLQGTAKPAPEFKFRTF